MRYLIRVSRGRETYSLAMCNVLPLALEIIRYHADENASAAAAYTIQRLDPPAEIHIAEPGITAIRAWRDYRTGWDDLNIILGLYRLGAP